MVALLALAGGMLALARSQVSPVLPTSGADTWVAGAPLTREARAGGLESVLQLTPGPYILGELLGADLSLRNDSRTTYTLAGPSVAGGCGVAVSLDLTGGRRPQYTVPVVTFHPCPLMTSTLAPGATMRHHEFLPLSNSGQVTLESGADFVQTIAGPAGSQHVTPGNSLLDGKWPALILSVAAATPVDRRLSLQ
jgi:hypothetical protein